MIDDLRVTPSGKPDHLIETYVYEQDVYDELVAKCTAAESLEFDAMTGEHVTTEWYIDGNGVVTCRFESPEYFLTNKFIRRELPNPRR